MVILDTDAIINNATLLTNDIRLQTVKELNLKLIKIELQLRSHHF